MADYLHPLAKRGLDASSSGRRIDESRRRYVGDGLEEEGSSASDFLARRPSQDFTDSDLRDLNMERPVVAPPNADQQYEALLRQQARIPMYEQARSFDDSLATSDRDHPFFARQESPDDSPIRAPGTRQKGPDTSAYDVPGRRESFNEGPVERPPGAHLPAPLPYKHAKKGFFRHYLDDPAVTAPVAPPPKKRGFFSKLRSLFSGRGWR